MAQPERGYIETIEGKYKRVNFLFNPTEYSISKQNQWSISGAKRGRDVATLEFGGGQPKQITLQLFFDTYEQEGGDVRDYTDGLLKLMQIDETLKSSNPNSGKGQPPKCRLQWGRVWSFKCVIENMTQKFTLFRDDGRPVRATVDLTLRQAEDENELPGQNPTTEGIPGRKVWTVKDGERLDWIAYQEYGDARLWRLIAEENRLEDPLNLRPGQTLVIPPWP